VRAAGISVLQMVWSAVTLLPVISGRTVILKTELSEQTPELTVLRNHVVVLRVPGWYDCVDAVRPVKLLLSVDDAHE